MILGICDDDLAIREQLQQLSERLIPAKQIRVYDTAKALLAECEGPDILLLDVQMPEMNGICAARELREKGSEALIIFITNYIQYAIDGYDVHAYHFLKKPIEEKRFMQVVGGALELTEKKLQSSVVVSGYDRQYRLSVSNILYCETERGHVLLHTGEGGTIRCTHSMQQMELLLKDQDFFRCHTAYLVNMAHIDCLRPSELVLTDGEIIAVSKHRKKELKEALSFYWSGNFV